MNELQAQLTAVQNQLAAEKAKGADKDINVIAQLEQQEADILKQMDEETNRQKQAAAIEDKVHADDVPFAIAGVDFTNMPDALIKVIEIVVKADRRRIYADHAAELEAVQTAGKSSLDALQAQYYQLKSDYTDQKAQTAQAIAERDDFTSKLANASAQLAEKDAEIAKLQAQATAVPPSPPVEDDQNTVEADTDEAAEINDALQKLYVSFTNYGTINKVVKPDGSTENIKTDELQTQWTQVTPEPPQAPIVTGGSDATGTFQNDPQAGAQDSGVPAPEGAADVGGTFPPQVPNDDNTVGGVGTNPTVATAQPSVTDRLTALEQKVTVLWNNQFIGQKENVTVLTSDKR